MPSEALLAIVLYLTSTRAVPPVPLATMPVAIARDLRAFDHGTRRDPSRGLDKDAAAARHATPLFVKTESVMVKCAPAAEGANWTATPGDPVKF